MLFFSFRPLFYLGMKLLDKFCVCEKLNIGEDVLKNWLQVTVVVKNSMIANTVEPA